MKMKKIHPRKDETYYVAMDDHCWVVSTTHLRGGGGMGYGRRAPRVWLSQSMIEWLSKRVKYIARNK